MKIKIAIYILLLASPMLFAEEEELDMDFLRPLYKVGGSEKAIPYLLKHLSSESYMTRHKIYNIMTRRLFELDPDSRYYIVEILTSRLGVFPADDKQIREALHSISPKYFSEKSKQNLFESYKKNGGPIRILGHANIREVIPDFKKRIADYHRKIEETKKECADIRQNRIDFYVSSFMNFLDSSDWAKNNKDSDEYKKRAEELTELAIKNVNSELPEDHILFERNYRGIPEFQVMWYYEGLARMGDREALDYCLAYYNRRVMEAVKREQDNHQNTPLDVLIEYGHSLNVEGYAYVRQPETVEFLYKLLMSENLHFRSLSNWYSPFAQDGFKGLVTCIVLDDVVMTKDPLGEYIPSQENIEILRKWMKDNYNPGKIMSLSVLIDGKIVNNFEKE